MSEKNITLDVETLDKDFQSVLDAFKVNFSKGDVASQFTVYHKGKKVINIAGAKKTKKLSNYSTNTNQFVYSNGKTVSALILGRFVDQGVLDYDSTVATYWPEFAQNGKENILVSDVLRHDAGLSFFSDGLVVENSMLKTEDRSGVREIMEKSKPLWEYEPKFDKGDRIYHTLTKGFIEDELCRRVDLKKRGIAEILLAEVGPEISNIVSDKEKEEEITFYSGNMPEEKQKDFLWPAYQPVTTALAYECSKAVRGFFGGASENAFKKKLPKEMVAEFDGLTKAYKKAGKKTYLEKSVRAVNSDPRRPAPDLLEIDAMSYNLVSNAKSLAAFGQAFILAEPSKRMLTDETLKKIFSEPTKKVDQVVGFPTVLCKGGVCSFKDPSYPSFVHSFYGWQGYGGSVFAFSLEHDISFAFVPQKLHLFALGGFFTPRCLRVVETLMKKVVELETKDMAAKDEP